MGNLTQTIISNWIGPIFIVIVAGAAITFLISKSLRALLTYTIVVVVVALFIFAGDALFGQSGTLTNSAKKVVDQVNMISPFLLR